MTERDWDLIFECAVLATYHNNEQILAQGTEIRRIYQIAEGQCRVELETGGKKSIIGSMNVGEIFGEITYLFGGGLLIFMLFIYSQVQMFPL